MNRTPFLLSDGPNGPLRGDLYVPENHRGAPVVVACHGFKGFKNWGFWPDTGRRFAEAGLALVTFNMSGSGIGDDLEAFTETQAFEHNTITREIEDLGRVLDAVAGRELPLGGVDIKRLGLLGHSRGGGVVLLRAGRDPRVGAVVTWAAVSRFHRYSPEEIQEWRSQGYIPVVNARTQQIFRLSTDLLDDLETHGEAYSPVEAIRRLEAPVLLLHGTRDEAVPADEASELHRAALPGKAKLGLIQGAGHTFGAAHPFTDSTPELDQASAKTTAWFTEHLA